MKYGYDSTLLMCTSLNHILESIEQIDRELREAKADNERLLEIVANHSCLNIRQKLLLQKAIFMPQKSITIKEIRDSTQVAYGTARSDLLGLEQMGFFVSLYQNSALNFRLSPDAETLLLEHRGSAAPQ